LTFIQNKTIPKDYEQLKEGAGKYLRDKIFVLYCAREHQEISTRTARQLVRMAFIEVFILQGGWREWGNALFPMKAK
jgi:rhodanese-related sulfurtransferase